jgi:hypothetical protein
VSTNRSPLSRDRLGTWCARAFPLRLRMLLLNGRLAAPPLPRRSKLARAACLEDREISRRAERGGRANPSWTAQPGRRCCGRLRLLSEGRGQNSWTTGPASPRGLEFKHSGGGRGCGKKVRESDTEALALAVPPPPAEVDGRSGPPQRRHVGREGRPGRGVVQRRGGRQGGELEQWARDGVVGEQGGAGLLGDVVEVVLQHALRELVHQVVDGLLRADAGQVQADALRHREVRRQRPANLARALQADTRQARVRSRRHPARGSKFHSMLHPAEVLDSSPFEKLEN